MNFCAFMVLLFAVGILGGVIGFVLGDEHGRNDEHNPKPFRGLLP
jgi:hypothetical protein